MITITKAGMKDAALIASLWEEFTRHHDGDLVKCSPKLAPHLEKKRNAEDIFLGYVKGRLSSPDARVLVAYVDGKPAGYCIHFIEKTIPVFSMKAIGYIGDLFVREPFRRMGISTMLKDDAFRWLKKRGMTHVSIKVYPGNGRAHSIYEKWGFSDYHVEMRRKL